MKKIAFVIAYFGKLPGAGFELWLLSCKKNPSIDWLIYTDDQTKYEYPSNVKVKYCSLENIRDRAQKCFEFPISLERPRKLCDYKAAYGEMFADDLKGYDYWGYCDIDLVWGNIRKFLTDDLLEKYDRIGYQGHCLLYKNTESVVKRYKTCIDGVTNYKEVFSSPKEFCFDENGLDAIYNVLGIAYYKETIFAHLEKYEYGFFLKYFPDEDAYKNKHQIFVWEDGTLLRNYVVGNEIRQEEFMYIHFFCRPMIFKTTKCLDTDSFVIYADKVEKKDSEITTEFIKKHSRNSALHYYCSSIWYNRKKLTPKRVISNIKRMIIRKKGKK